MFERKSLKKFLILENIFVSKKIFSMQFLISIFLNQLQDAKTH